MTTNNIMLQEAMTKAVQIKKFVENRKKDDARDVAKDLYEIGLKMVKAELENHPIIPDTETPHTIIQDIHSALSDPGFHSFTRFQYSVAKVQRIFIELSWYQAWRINSISGEEEVHVPDSFRDDLIKAAQLSEDILSHRSNTSDVRFEHRCAKQAAKCLHPITPVWKTYSAHVAHLTSLTLEKDAVCIWDAINNLLKDLQKDCPLGWQLWYQIIHILRWEAITIQTVEDFNNKLTPHIFLCKEEGFDLSFCLATVLWELIKRPGLEKSVKQRAFKGDDNNQEGFIHLINWEQPNSFIDFFKHPSEIYRTLFKKADRFWETRDFVTHRLIKLATKKKYEEYKQDSLSALQARKEELIHKKSKRYKKERKKLQSFLSKLRKRQGVVENQIERIEKKQIAINTNNKTKEDVLQNLKRQLSNESKKIGARKVSLTNELNTVAVLGRMAYEEIRLIDSASLKDKDDSDFNLEILEK